MGKLNLWFKKKKSIDRIFIDELIFFTQHQKNQEGGGGNWKVDESSASTCQVMHACWHSSFTPLFTVSLPSWIISTLLTSWFVWLCIYFSNMMAPAIYLLQGKKRRLNTIIVTRKKMVSPVSILRTSLFADVYPQLWYIFGSSENWKRQWWMGHCPY